MAAALLALTLLGSLFSVTVTGARLTPALLITSFSPPGLAASAPMLAVTELEAAPVPLTVVAPSVTAEELLAAVDGTAQALSTLVQAQRASSVEVEGATSSSEPERIPIYWTYEVQSGDNLTKVAERFGVGRDYILWNNADLIDDQNLLAIGDKLQIPAVEGMIHGVSADETLTAIALRYDADVQDVIDFQANGISDPNLLPVGKLILVVGGSKPQPIAPSLRPIVGVDVGPGGFAWPIAGPIEVTSYWGPVHPLGIDLNARYQSLFASRAGQVVFIGGDPHVSYGWYIDIRHDGGWVTRYAHLSEFKVSLGQWVEAGDVIAITGNSGRSTGPHLHFEIRRNDVVQNPLQWLP